MHFNPLNANCTLRLLRKTLHISRVPEIGKTPGYCTNSSIRHDDSNLPSRTAEIESATNIVAVLYAPQSSRHMNKYWLGSKSKPKAQHLISPGALDICSLKDKKYVAIGDLCILASFHVGITKTSFNIFNEISDCSSSEDTRSQVPESRSNPRLLHCLFHQARIWQFVILLPLQTWNLPETFPLSCILLELTGNWISTDQQVAQNQDIILSSPAALDNCSLKDKTCITLGDLCISDSIHVGIRKKSLAFHIFNEKTQGTVLSLPPGMAMAICHPSSTADLEFNANFATIMSALRSNRDMNNYWTARYVKPRSQQLCSPVALEMCSWKDKIVRYFRRFVHYGVSSCRTGNFLETLLLWWESQTATIRHKFCHCPECSLK